MARRGGSLEYSAESARAARSGGHYNEAARHYRALIGQTHVIDYEYDEWLRELAVIYGELRRNREAGLIFAYLHYFGDARRCFAGTAFVDVGMRARLSEVEKHWPEAAKLYAEAKLPVHSAVAHERASNWTEAASGWDALLSHPRLRGQEYELALVQFNLGMVLARSDDKSSTARRALIDSQRRLEQVADNYETSGELERAFDCYQILLKLGRDSGQFENLAEGYINCIRVLREDNLKFYVLQYYEDFIKLALERSEFHAAATLYQEAAEYAARAGLPYDRRYQAQSARTWLRYAEQGQATDAPIQLVENALLAAAGQFSAVSNYGGVRSAFEQLSQLDVSDRARRRFATIAAKFEGAPADAPEGPKFPDYLRQQNAYADIWFVDLLEWELDGDPHGVAASIVADLRYPNGIRRRALVLLLTLAEAESERAAVPPADEISRQLEIAELLGELQSYAALAPLERLYQHVDPQVRRAAVRALRFLYFKRSFSIVRRALLDGDVMVRDAALVAIAGLHFPHAFNPLGRIYTTSSDPKVRTTALTAIGKIQSIEAGEFLVMVVRQETGVLRDTAYNSLAAIDNADVLPIIRQHLEVETDPDVRTMLGMLVSRRAG